VNNIGTAAASSRATSTPTPLTAGLDVVEVDLDPPEHAVSAIVVATAKDLRLTLIR